jgi:hypothetical protein
MSHTKSGGNCRTLICRCGSFFLLPAEMVDAVAVFLIKQMAFDTGTIKQISISLSCWVLLSFPLASRALHVWSYDDDWHS